MASITQDDRLLRFDSALGSDELILHGLNGEEKVSDLFCFDLELFSSDPNLSAEKIVGTAADIEIHNGVDGDKVRYINGIVSRFVAGRFEGGTRHYRAQMVPWFWLLMHTSNCRIYQAQSAKDIITAIFGDHGFSKYEFRSITCEKRDYCVQFGESDFNFISRLLEEEGISYHFIHSKGDHKLILTQSNQSFEQCDESEAIVDYGNRPGENFISSWERHYSFTSGKWSHNDYDFLAPTKALKTEAKTIVSWPANSKLEHYDYPGHYCESTLGKSYTKYRMEAEEAHHDVTEAQSNCATFYAGGRFKVSEHPSSSDKGNYLISKIVHHASDLGSGQSSGSPSYTNTLSCIPSDNTIRPIATTHKPQIHGMQTAVVVGPSGEEIYTDEHGRVKVQFHWDREGKNDDKSSCWIRVSQSWAGKKYGSFFTPRIGFEVLVSFIDGDPDRPIIMGGVYNGDNAAPYAAAKSQSGFKTASTKNGAAADYNELRFEDKKDSEEIHMQAQKDYTRYVKNLEKATIDGNQEQTVKVDRIITITEGNETHTLDKGDQSLVLTEGSQDSTIAKDVTTTIGENNTVSVGKDQNIDIAKKQSLDVGDAQTIKVKKDQKVTVGGDQKTSVTGAASIDAKEVKLSGKTKIEMKVGGNSIKIDSMGITIKVGGNSIKLDPAGVTIKGTMVKIDGSAMTEVKGGAMVTVKGGITMIN